MFDSIRLEMILLLALVLVAGIIWTVLSANKKKQQREERLREIQKRLKEIEKKSKQNDANA